MLGKHVLYHKTSRPCFMASWWLENVIILLYFLFFWDKVSPCVSGWLGTHCSKVLAVKHGYWVQSPEPRYRRKELIPIVVSVLCVLWPVPQPQERNGLKKSSSPGVWEFFFIYYLKFHICCDICVCMGVCVHVCACVHIVCQVSSHWTESWLWLGWPVSPGELPFSTF